MRFLLKVSIPNELFNSYVKNGTAGQFMQQILNDLKPEAVYFTDMHGSRGGVMIVNDNASQIPRMAEGWFLRFDADINLHPVMSPKDLANAGLEELGRKYA